LAYDEGLEQRVLDLLAGRSDLESKRMFGGVGFMIGGNMACGVHDDRLIVRVGPDAYESALSRPDTAVFDLTGRPMKGWITVGPDGYSSDADLAAWVQRGLDFALTLPPK
jgi:hypothetical protein